MRQFNNMLLLEVLMNGVRIPTAVAWKIGVHGRLFVSDQESGRCPVPLTDAGTSTAERIDAAPHIDPLTDAGTPTAEGIDAAPHIDPLADEAVPTAEMVGAAPDLAPLADEKTPTVERINAPDLGDRPVGIGDASDLVLRSVRNQPSGGD
jgi:hypothetical protein